MVLWSRALTQFSFEVPVAHLDDFQPYQDFVFGLCFLTYTHPKYSQYIHDVCDAGELYVIIDNSFNETNIPIASQEMVRIFREFSPDQVVAPDADWWNDDTIVSAYNDLLRDLPRNAVLSVFRNNQQLHKLIDAGSRNLTIPYEWRQGADLAKCNELHYLGLGNLDEILAHRPYSLDTSIPIKMALRGETFQDWVASGGQYIRHHPHEVTPTRLARVMNYFNTRMTDVQLELAVNNIKALKAVVNGAAN